MTGFFFSFMGHSWKRYFSTRTAAKIITVIIFLLIIFGIAAGVFFGVRAGFTLMKAQAYGSQTLPLYTYEVFFLVLGYLMFASAIISGLFIIFRADRNEWIAASPRFKTMLVQAGSSIFESAIWTLLVIGIPAIVALAQVYGGGTISIPLALIGLVLLTVIVSALAMLLILLLASLLYRINGTNWHALRMRWLGLVCAIFVAMLTYSLGHMIIGMNVLALFVSGPVTAAEANINGIVAAFQFLPTNGMALLMLALQNHDWLTASQYLGWLALAAVVVIFIIYLFSFDYLRVWQRMQEGGFEARSASSLASASGVKVTPQPFPRFFKSQIGAIFEKEAIVNFRNLRDSLWVLFILGLWILQTALNIFLRRNATEYGTSEVTILASIQAIQAATAVFFISTFTLRFVLPSFSGERRMRWILGTAPIAPRRIYLSKLVFYSLIFLILGIGIGIANAAILGVPLAAAEMFLALLFVMIVGITVFGLTIGALLPNAESSDPESVSTSLPGLGFTFASLAYGALGVWSYYEFLRVWQSALIEVFIAASVVAIVCMAVASVNKLKTFNPFSEELA